jgi:hypothetical protein
MFFIFLKKNRITRTSGSRFLKIFKELTKNRQLRVGSSVWLFNFVDPSEP